LSAITAVSIEDLIAGSPGWLADLRREAWNRYGELAYPEGREEIWRFTDVKALHPANFRLLAPDAEPEVAPRLEALDLSGVASSGRAVHVDTATVDLRLSDEARSKGVVLCDLETAVREHADLLRPRLGSLVAADEPHTALSLAAHHRGTFLYVPNGVELKEPFQALHWLSPQAAGALVMPRTVVIVEDGADIVFNDVYDSDPLGAATLAAPVTEMFIGRNAKVGWVTWQDWGAGTKHLAHVRAQLDRDALLNTLVVTLGGDYSRTWKECTLAGEGAESYMYGLYFSHGDQRFEHWTLQDHVAPHTTSDLLYKGALTDSSQALYYGTIHIRPHARKSNAYQANRNLALSDRARAMPNPQLEIENNDVRCTHGATVGKISDEHLFYLASRGIPPEEARRLIVFGFFNQVLDQVTWSGMHERLADAIQAKMEGQRT
jgi:Fe-S cluster assembly protein SufD